IFNQTKLATLEKEKNKKEGELTAKVQALTTQMSDKVEKREREERVRELMRELGSVKSNIERLERLATARAEEKGLREELDLTITTLRESVDKLTNENQELKVPAIAMNTSAKTNFLKGTNKDLGTQNRTLQADAQRLAESERLTRETSDNAAALILKGVQARATLLKKCDNEAQVLEAQLLDAQTTIERLQNERSVMVSKYQTELQDKQKEGSSSLMDAKNAELEVGLRPFNVRYTPQFQQDLRKEIASFKKASQTSDSSSKRIKELEAQLKPLQERLDGDWVQRTKKMLADQQKKVVDLQQQLANSKNVASTWKKTEPTSKEADLLKQVAALQKDAETRSLDNQFLKNQISVLSRLPSSHSAAAGDLVSLQTEISKLTAMN
ncbi:hypothetical protein F5878DRAFT_647919, partial [Lentinula raphanica]